MNQSTINAEIRKLVASIGKDLSLKIAWPNLPFNDINDPYLQLHIMPVETDNIGLSQDMPVYRGVIQINVVGKVGVETRDSQRLLMMLSQDWRTD